MITPINEYFKDRRQVMDRVSLACRSRLDHPIRKKDWISWFSQQLIIGQLEGIDKWRAVAKKLKMFKNSELQRIYNTCRNGDFNKIFNQTYQIAKQDRPPKPKQGKMFK